MKKSFVLAVFLIFLSPSIIHAIRIVHGPYLQNVYQTEATIVWLSDKPSVGWVELAPDDGTNFYAEQRSKFYDTKIGVKRTDSLHVVRLTGLTPGVTYRYRVFSKEVLSHTNTFVQYGKVASTDVYREKPLTFKTLEENKKDVSFVVLNDVHGRHDVITPLLKYADYQNRDMIFFNGDMISIVNKGEDFFTGFMDECIGLFAKNKSPYYVRGNHETRGKFATHFQDYFNPRQSHLYGAMHMGPVYIIMLDTGEDKPDDDIEYSVKFTPILNDMNIDLMICGHLHRDMYCEPNSRIKYPVLVNSNQGSVEVNTQGDKFKAVVRHLDGKVVWEREYSAR